MCVRIPIHKCCVSAKAPHLVLSLAMTQRKQALQLNALIDRLLTSPEPQHRQQLAHLVTDASVNSLAERIRRRATRLGKLRHGDQRQLLQMRDELILAVYAALSPAGWCCGWSDGAVFTLHTHRQAGIGGLLMDGTGAVIARISERIGEADAFSAELAATTAIIDLAIARQQLWLWLFCDNSGLVRLWCEQRNDPRLEPLRQRVEKLDKFALRAIPRLHNQPANALARMAVKGKSSTR